MIVVAFSGHARDRESRDGTGLYNPGYDREVVMGMIRFRIERDLEWSVIRNSEVAMTVPVDVLFCSRDARLRKSALVLRQVCRNPGGLFDYTALFNILLRGGTLRDQIYVDGGGNPKRAGYRPPRPRLDDLLRRVRL